MEKFLIGTVLLWLSIQVKVLEETFEIIHYQLIYFAPFSNNSFEKNLSTLCQTLKEKSKKTKRIKTFANIGKNMFF